MKNLRENLQKSSVTMIVSALFVGLTGCATTKSIIPEYVSPTSYQSYDCSQLQIEQERINVYIKHNSKSDFNLASTGINIGLFGSKNGISPTISLGSAVRKDNDTYTDRLAKLYGERDALIQSARMKKCGFTTGMKLYGE